MRESDVETIRETLVEAGVRGPDLIHLVDRAQVVNPTGPLPRVIPVGRPYGYGARKAHAVARSRIRLRKLASNAQN